MTISLLSDNQNLRSYQYHYGAIVVPFVFISTMHSVNYIKKRVKTPHVEKFLFYYILFSAIITAYFYSPIPGMKDADYRPYTIQNTNEINRYLSLIPPRSSVSASNNIGAHLSHRENVYVIPYAINSADFIVLFGEKKSVVNSVQHLRYDTLVQDTKNNFYIFKKKTLTGCDGKHCLP
jgi:uncharacterized membrane protein